MFCIIFNCTHFAFQNWFIVKHFVMVVLTGLNSWPPGCSLKFILGDQLGSTERVMVDALQAGDECNVSVPMVSPKSSGMYHGQWRMCSPTGTLFGGIDHSL